MPFKNKLYRLPADEPRIAPPAAPYAIVLKYNSRWLTEQEFSYHSLGAGLLAFQSFKRYIGEDFTIKLYRTATGETIAFAQGTYKLP